MTYGFWVVSGFPGFEELDGAVSLVLEEFDGEASEVAGDVGVLWRSLRPWMLGAKGLCVAMT